MLLSFMPLVRFLGQSFERKILKENKCMVFYRGKKCIRMYRNV